MSRTAGAVAARAEVSRGYGMHPATDYGVQSEPAAESSLEGIRRRIACVRDAVEGLHRIADHACGHAPPRADGQPGSANGALDAIEAELDDLLALTNGAVQRLLRLGSA